MRKLRTVAAVAAATIAGALTWATPAYATEDQQAPDTTAEVTCPTSRLRSGSVVDDVWTWGKPAPGAQVASPDKVVLTKPDAVKPGSEFVLTKLNINLALPTTISVDYQLSTEASYEGTAIRMFYYAAADPNTDSDAPTATVDAKAVAGKLTLAATGKVGAIGFTYDASNDARGSVTFSSLRVGTIQIKFKRVAECERIREPQIKTTPPTCDKPTQTVKVFNPNWHNAVKVRVGVAEPVDVGPRKHASVDVDRSVFVWWLHSGKWKVAKKVLFKRPSCPTATATAVPSATATAAPSSSPRPSLSPAAGVGGGTQPGGLPVTGASVLTVSALGVLLLVGGGIALVTSRRRRTRFTA